MTFRTILGTSKWQNCLHCLISWPDEDDTLSVVFDQKIISPPEAELIPGCMCKVNGFEKNCAKIVAVRSHVEKLDEINKESEETEPPKKWIRRTKSRPK